MTIRPDLALGARFDPLEYTWTADDVIRYHLAIGAGSPLCAGPELRYVYEDDLQVLPTFAALPASAAAAVASRAPGLDYDPELIVQTGHEVETFAPLPTSATTRNQARVDAVYDQGKACSFVVAVVTSTLDGADLAVNRFVMMLPGEGGFGGQPAPRRAQAPPTRPPDAVRRIVTLPQQGALFRMSGDRHRLHIDPAVATAAGFEAPPLPGLCTWSMVAKAVVDSELDGDPTRMTGFAARFVAPVYPGDTLEVSMWRGSDVVEVEACVAGHQTAALPGGVVKILAETEHR